LFKIVGFGVFVVPAAHFIAQTYQLDVVIVSMPLLVIVLALLYLSEDHALMRCGHFIRYYVENHVPDVLGWETWLEADRKLTRRTVDRFLSYCFYLLFFVYYTGSVFIAGRHVQKVYDLGWLGILLGIYIAVGIWFLIFLIKNIQVSTSTMDEKWGSPPAQVQQGTTTNT
jgi:uncharacterized membrane protein